MTPKAIQVAVDEALRFLKRADEFKERRGMDGHYVGSSPESGALKRASMDLTRALAAMRKT